MRLQRIKLRAQAHEIEQRYGVRAVDVAKATQIANTLLIAVKPQDIAGLLSPLVGPVAASHLVIPVSAVVPPRFIARQLGAA